MLSAARVRGDHVLLLSHIPASYTVCGPTAVPWDVSRLTAVLRRHPGAVALALAGHDHAGAVGWDRRARTCFVTVPAPIEAAEGGGALAVIEVRPRRVDIRGLGDVPDVTVELE